MTVSKVSNPKMGILMHNLRVCKGPQIYNREIPGRGSWTNTNSFYGRCTTSSDYFSDVYCVFADFIKQSLNALPSMKNITIYSLTARTRQAGAKYLPFLANSSESFCRMWCRFSSTSISRGKVWSSLMSRSSQEGTGGKLCRSNSLTKEPLSR